MKYFAAILFAVLLWASPAEAQRGRGGEFNCTMISTAEVLTELTGCPVLTTGQRRYITGISWSSSIISTTVNFMLIQSGTGVACATGTTSHYAGFALAFTEAGGTFGTPIMTGANAAICFIHAGAGTRNIQVTGFVE